MTKFRFYAVAKISGLAAAAAFVTSAAIAQLELPSELASDLNDAIQSSRVVPNQDVYDLASENEQYAARIACIASQYFENGDLLAEKFGGLFDDEDLSAQVVQAVRDCSAGGPIQYSSARGQFIAGYDLGWNDASENLNQDAVTPTQPF